MQILARREFVIGIAILAGLAGCSMPTMRIPEAEQPTAVPALPTPTISFYVDYANSTPLQHLPFPNVPEEVPAGWPGRYLLPKQFVPVEFINGTEEVSERFAWGTKYIFDGDSEEARRLASQFLQDGGWVIGFSGERQNSVVFVAQLITENFITATINLEPDLQSDLVRVLVLFSD